MSAESLSNSAVNVGVDKSVVKAVWLSRGDDLMYGAGAPPDIDKSAVLAEWLSFTEGLSLDDLTPEERHYLLGKTIFMPLHSVVKADEHFIDPDDCGGWHTEGSGKRSRPAWWLHAGTLSAVIDAVLDRKKETTDAC